jgi:hypothetical protein
MAAELQIDHLPRTADIRPPVPSVSCVMKETAHAPVYTVRLDRYLRARLARDDTSAWAHPTGAQPTIDYLIGVLPNFAAAIAITFVLLRILADPNRDADFNSAQRPFLFCIIVGGVGLVAWELFQKTSSRLVFDPHDGVVLPVFCFAR